MELHQTGSVWIVVYLRALYWGHWPEAVQCPLRMFADDTKVFSQVDDDQDASRLQEDLEALSVWSVTWIMSFNEDKCSVLHIGHANHGFKYTMNGKPITSTAHRLRRIWVCLLTLS